MGGLNVDRDDEGVLGERGRALREDIGEVLQSPSAPTPSLASSTLTLTSPTPLTSELSSDR